MHLQQKGYLSRGGRHTQIWKVRQNFERARPWMDGSTSRVSRVLDNFAGSFAVDEGETFVDPYISTCSPHRYVVREIVQGKVR